MPKTRLLVPVDNHVYCLPMSAVISLETEGQGTLVRVQHRAALHSKQRLGQLSEQLEGQPRFVRINRSAVINIQYIEKLIKGNETGTVILSDRTVLPISKRRRNEVYAFLDEHLL